MASPAISKTAGAPVTSQMEEMRTPFVVAVAFHLAILLLAIFGMHFFPTKPIETPTPISVSMVKPSDIARTNHVDVPQEEKEPPVDQQQSKAPEPPKESTPPPPPPEPVQPPAQQKVEAPPPPPPPPPAPEAPPEKPLPKLAPVPQAQTAFEKPAQLPPLQKPVQPVVKQQPKVDPKKTKQMDQDFQSLLTNLAPPVPKADQISKDKPVKSAPKAASEAQQSTELTADEMARVRQQLAGCWVIPAGAMQADQLVIEVETEFNPDRTLHAAQLVDTQRYNSDPFFRAAADSVLRALHNPACNPLELPPNKYEEWHSMKITFNPKTMLGL